MQVKHVKMPKEIKTGCPFCKAHKIHKVSVVKRKERGTLKAGQRRYLRIIKGYRGFPRPSAKVVKQTKKIDIRLECQDCKKKHVKTRTFRAKKFELTR